MVSLPISQPSGQAAVPTILSIAAAKSLWALYALPASVSSINSSALTRASSAATTAFSPASVIRASQVGCEVSAGSGLRCHAARNRFAVSSKRSEGAAHRANRQSVFDDGGRI